MKQKLFEIKIFKKEGALHHFIKIDGTLKLSSWDGPSIVPVDPGCILKKEYYINGIKLTKEQWEERVKEQNGVPFYKQGNSNERF